MSKHGLKLQLPIIEFVPDFTYEGLLIGNNLSQIAKDYLSGKITLGMYLEKELELYYSKMER